MTAEEAEILAIRALGFIAGDDYKLRALFAQTGLAPERLSTAGTDAAVQIGIIEFLMRHEAWAEMFVTELDGPADLLPRALAALDPAAARAGGHAP